MTLFCRLPLDIGETQKQMSCGNDRKKSNNKSKCKDGGVRGFPPGRITFPMLLRERWPPTPIEPVLFN
jgi:hypothetical protein